MTQVTHDASDIHIICLCKLIDPIGAQHESVHPLAIGSPQPEPQSQLNILPLSVPICSLPSSHHKKNQARLLIVPNTSLYVCDRRGIDGSGRLR
jgi:hypothetical protein